MRRKGGINLDYSSGNLVEEYNKKILDLVFELYKKDVEIQCLKDQAKEAVKADSSFLDYPNDMSYNPNS